MKQYQFLIGVVVTEGAVMAFYQVRLHYLKE